MVHFGFFCSSIVTSVPSPLLCSTCLPRVVIYVSFEKVSQTLKKPAMEFFWKSYWLTESKFVAVETQDKCLPWNH